MYTIDVRNEAHEHSLPKREWHQQHDWIVTRPDGTEFGIRWSEPLMAEYYGKAGWDYRRA